MATPVSQPWAWALSVTTIFAAVVIAAAGYHEPWRDEVVPLSIARHADSLRELAAPLRFEGHPILWYLVLWIGLGVFGQSWVLKAASLASAIGAMLLWNRSRLPWWLLGLFTFSYFPLYQYSVVSRGYSLEMLLLFLCCTLVPHRRAHPVALATALALLANTESFGTVMAIAAGVMLLVDAAMTRGGADRRRLDGWTGAAIVIYVLGFVPAVAVAFPDVGHRGTAVYQLDATTIAAGLGKALVWPVAHATRIAVVPWPSLWVWAWFVYLARTPSVLCFAMLSLVGVESILNLVHGTTATWHIGNHVLVIVATLWLDGTAGLASRPDPEWLARVRPWLGRVLLAGFVVLLLSFVVLAADAIRSDVRYDNSSNRELARLLDADPALADAVIMAEPDVLSWSVPYYTRRRVFLPREDLFRDWGIFAPPRRPDYDLGALLAAAKRVQAECACPVVIALGWDLDPVGVRTNFPGTRFAETFAVTAQQRDAFVAATRPLAARGSTMTDEWYDVFLLR